jgi:Dockerin type I repeat.
VVVDPQAIIAEADETNNVGTDTIHVSAFHTCDINRDGFVNAIDVQLCVNAILGISIGAMDADVNDDSSVNALDLQRVVNAVIGA